MTIDATSGAAPAPSPSAPDSPDKNISLLARAISIVCRADSCGAGVVCLASRFTGSSGEHAREVFRAASDDLTGQLSRHLPSLLVLTGQVADTLAWLAGAAPPDSVSSVIDIPEATRLLQTPEAQDLLAKLLLPEDAPGGEFCRRLTELAEQLSKTAGAVTRACLKALPQHLKMNEEVLSGLMLIIRPALKTVPVGENAAIFPVSDDALNLTFRFFLAGQVPGTTSLPDLLPVLLANQVSARTDILSPLVAGRTPEQCLAGAAPELPSPPAGESMAGSGAENTGRPGATVTPESSFIPSDNTAVGMPDRDFSMPAYDTLRGYQSDALGPGQDMVLVRAGTSMSFGREMAADEAVVCRLPAGQGNATSAGEFPGGAAVTTLAGPGSSGRMVTEKRVTTGYEPLLFAGVFHAARGNVQVRVNVLQTGDQIVETTAISPGRPENPVSFSNTGAGNTPWSSEKKTPAGERPGNFLSPASGTGDLRSLEVRERAALGYEGLHHDLITCKSVTSSGTRPYDYSLIGSATEQQWLQRLGMMLAGGIMALGGGGVALWRYMLQSSPTNNSTTPMPQPAALRSGRRRAVGWGWGRMFLPDFLSTEKPNDQQALNLTGTLSDSPEYISDIINKVLLTCAGKRINNNGCPVKIPFKENIKARLKAEGGDATYWGEDEQTFLKNVILKKNIPNLGTYVLCQVLGIRPTVKNQEKIRDAYMAVIVYGIYDIDISPVYPILPELENYIWTFPLFSKGCCLALTEQLGSIFNYTLNNKQNSYALANIVVNDVFLRKSHVDITKAVAHILPYIHINTPIWWSLLSVGFHLSSRNNITINDVNEAENVIKERIIPGGRYYERMIEEFTVYPRCIMTYFFSPNLPIKKGAKLLVDTLHKNSVEGERVQTDVAEWNNKMQSILMRVWQLTPNRVKGTDTAENSIPLVASDWKQLRTLCSSGLKAVYSYLVNNVCPILPATVVIKSINARGAVVNFPGAIFEFHFANNRTMVFYLNYASQGELLGNAEQAPAALLRLKKAYWNNGTDRTNSDQPYENSVPVFQDIATFKVNETEKIINAVVDSVFMNPRNMRDWLLETKLFLAKVVDTTKKSLWTPSIMIPVKSCVEAAIEGIGKAEEAAKPNIMWPKQILRTSIACSDATIAVMGAGYYTRGIIKGAQRLAHSVRIEMGSPVQLLRRATSLSGSYVAYDEIGGAVLIDGLEPPESSGSVTRATVLQVPQKNSYSLSGGQYTEQEGLDGIIENDAGNWEEISLSFESTLPEVEVFSATEGFTSTNSDSVSTADQFASLQVAIDIRRSNSAPQLTGAAGGSEDLTQNRNLILRGIDYWLDIFTLNVGSSLRKLISAGAQVKNTVFYAKLVKGVAIGIGTVVAFEAVKSFIIAAIDKIPDGETDKAESSTLLLQATLGINNGQLQMNISSTDNVKYSIPPVTRNLTLTPAEIEKLPEVLFRDINNITPTSIMPLERVLKSDYPSIPIANSSNLDIQLGNEDDNEIGSTSMVFVSKDISGSVDKLAMLAFPSVFDLVDNRENADSAQQQKKWWVLDRVELLKKIQPEVFLGLKYLEHGIALRNMEVDCELKNGIHGGYIYSDIFSDLYLKKFCKKVGYPNDKIQEGLIVELEAYRYYCSNQDSLEIEKRTSEDMMSKILHIPLVETPDGTPYMNYTSEKFSDFLEVTYNFDKNMQGFILEINDVSITQSSLHEIITNSHLNSLRIYNKNIPAIAGVLIEQYIRIHG